MRRTKETVESRIRFVGHMDGADRRMEETDHGVFFSLDVVRLNTTYDGSENGPVGSLQKVCRR